MNDSTVIVRVERLTRYYNSFVAVNGISFNIGLGEVFGLLGPNGAGKSTTIKMLTTLLPPSSGNAYILGEDIVHHPGKVRQQIGYVPQLLSADGELTGYENLLLSAKLYGIHRSLREERIYEILEFMDLLGASHRLVKQYSGGMIRRLEIAMALIHRPPVLFLDEPSIGLDPAARRVLWDRIQNLQKEFKTTILLTTHDMEEADLLCNTVAFMHRGEIIALDSPEALKASMHPQATLDDVFIHYTGVTIQEGGGYTHVKDVRRTISHLG